MTIQTAIEELLGDLDEVANLFEQAGQKGYPSGVYAANAIRERRSSLIERLAQDEAMEITARLMDMVPSSKDLDSIGFQLARHPEIIDLLESIDAKAADLSFHYLPEDDKDDA